MTQNLINIRNILFQQVKNCPLSWHPLSCLWCPWLIYRRALNPPEDLTGNKEGKKDSPKIEPNSKQHVRPFKMTPATISNRRHNKSVRWVRREHKTTNLFFVFLIQIELVILCNNRISAMSVEAWKNPIPFVVNTTHKLITQSK